MASNYDDTDFIDRDFEPAALSYDDPPVTPAPASAFTSPGASAAPRKSAPSAAPSREELDQRVGLTQQRLAELKQAQEDLERERAALEETRRRRIEFQTGRKELLEALTRAGGILEEAAFARRREAEQMAKTLEGIREALRNVEGLNEESWSPENWTRELTRSLTILENARMEWNSARVKWPQLDNRNESGGEGAAGRTGAGPFGGAADAFGDVSFGRLCRFGLALTWPIAAVLAVWAILTLVLRLS